MDKSRLLETVKKLENIRYIMLNFVINFNLDKIKWCVSKIDQ